MNYWTDLFPFIVLMSLGMGLMFVPMTLAAVHGVGHRDSGIGSGVLNTMQQVGGAIGLATLSTIAVHFTQERATALVGAIKAANPAAAVPPRRPPPPSSRSSARPRSPTAPPTPSSPAPS